MTNRLNAKFAAQREKKLREMLEYRIDVLVLDEFPVSGAEFWNIEFVRHMETSSASRHREFFSALVKSTARNVVWINELETSLAAKVVSIVHCGFLRSRWHRAFCKLVKNLKPEVLHTVLNHYVAPKYSWCIADAHALTIMLQRTEECTPIGGSVISVNPNGTFRESRYFIDTVELLFTDTNDRVQFGNIVLFEPPDRKKTVLICLFDEFFSWLENNHTPCANLVLFLAALQVTPAQDWRAEILEFVTEFYESRQKELALSADLASATENMASSLGEWKQHADSVVAQHKDRELIDATDLGRINRIGNSLANRGRALQKTSCRSRKTVELAKKGMQACYVGQARVLVELGLAVHVVLRIMEYTFWFADPVLPELHRVRCINQLTQSVRARRLTQLTREIE